jgi:hypothetical protein
LGLILLPLFLNYFKSSVRRSQNSFNIIEPILLIFVIMISKVFIFKCFTLLYQFGFEIVTLFLIIFYLIIKSQIFRIMNKLVFFIFVSIISNF